MSEWEMTVVIISFQVWQDNMITSSSCYFNKQTWAKSQTNKQEIETEDGRQYTLDNRRQTLETFGWRVNNPNTGIEQIKCKHLTRTQITVIAIRKKLCSLR